jgi:hypothetical protein
MEILLIGINTSHWIYNGLGATALYLVIKLCLEAWMNRTQYT